MLNLAAIQQAIHEHSLDGWLFTDQHGRDPLAYRILGLDPSLRPSRRWFFFLPASGDPQKLVHRIEAGSLEPLPGRAALYARWEERVSALQSMLSGSKRVAMQYSPFCAIPYVSTVDAGSVDLIRSLGIEVVSSANLIQQFDAVLTPAQMDSHFEAGRRMDRIRSATFLELGRLLSAGGSPTEFDLYVFVRTAMDREGLVTDHGPIVAVNSNASDPHYEPRTDRASTIDAGDLVLLDMWAKLREPQAIYYDITWMAHCGPNVSPRIGRVFETARSARDAAVEGIRHAARCGQPIRGCDVDALCRKVIEAAGFGDAFFHRTGHSIGVSVHATGANMDGFETQDTRRLLPNTCFSIEPGIYLPEFGVRTEVNVMMRADDAVVTGDIQKEIVRILA